MVGGVAAAGLRVTDDGYQPASYFRRVLARLRHPGRGALLRWQRVVSFYLAALYAPATGGRPVRRHEEGPEVERVGCGGV